RLRKSYSGRARRSFSRGGSRASLYSSLRCGVPLRSLTQFSARFAIRSAVGLLQLVPRSLRIKLVLFGDPIEFRLGFFDLPNALQGQRMVPFRFLPEHIDRVDRGAMEP